MDRRTKNEQIKEILYEIESLIGSSSLKLMLQRIFCELDKKGYEVPESPTNVDLSMLTEEELNKFLKLLLEVIGRMLGKDFKENLIKKLENKYGTDNALEKNLKN